jgi:hypothetical protein
MWIISLLDLSVSREYFWPRCYIRRSIVPATQCSYTRTHCYETSNFSSSYVSDRDICSLDRKILQILNAVIFVTTNLHYHQSAFQTWTSLTPYWWSFTRKPSDTNSYCIRSHNLFWKWFRIRPSVALYRTELVMMNWRSSKIRCHSILRSCWWCNNTLSYLYFAR